MQPAYNLQQLMGGGAPAGTSHNTHKLILNALHVVSRSADWYTESNEVQ
jgi:hypothetical protein